jgi:hypothetical protein
MRAAPLSSLKKVDAVKARSRQALVFISRTPQQDKELSLTRIRLLSAGQFTLIHKLLEAVSKPVRP